MEALGAVNAYAPYRWRGPALWTVNLAAGVTPFIHLWRGREYVSALYCVGVGTGRLTVTHAHYRPARDEFDALPPDVQDHVLNGGLLLAELREARQLPDDPVKEEWPYESFQTWCLAYYGRRLPPLLPARKGG